jgi:hypothetical protein
MAVTPVADEAIIIDNSTHTAAAITSGLETHFMDLKEPGMYILHRKHNDSAKTFVDVNSTTDVSVEDSSEFNAVILRADGPANTKTFFIEWVINYEGIVDLDGLSGLGSKGRVHPTALAVAPSVSGLYSGSAADTFRDIEEKVKSGVSMATSLWNTAEAAGSLFETVAPLLLGV